jgi:hypothetical protein
VLYFQAILRLKEWSPREALAVFILTHRRRREYLFVYKEGEVMASYNDSLIDLVRRVTEARSIEYWVEEGGTVSVLKSNIAAIVGVSVDKTDDLLEMVSVLEDDPRYSLEQLDQTDSIKGSKGKEYPARVTFRFSAA